MLLSVIWLLYLLVKLVSRLFLDEADVSVSRVPILE